MQRILVTGGSGFMGRPALAALASKAEVHAVWHRAPISISGVTWHQGDLLDQAFRRGVLEAIRVHTVLHAAWDVGHDVFWTAQYNLDWTVATLELLRRATDVGVQRFVGVGTCFEYAGADCSQSCQELSSQIVPLTLYGISKDICRRAVEAFAESQDLSWAWARLFFPLGPEEKATRLVPSIVSRLLAGERVEIHSPKAVRDFVDVRDAGSALAALAMSSVTGPVNVGSGRGVSIGELAQLLGRLIGREDLIVHLELMPTESPERLVADVGRLTQEVNFHNLQSLDSTLLDAIAYWRGCHQADTEGAISQ